MIECDEISEMNFAGVDISTFFSYDVDKFVVEPLVGKSTQTLNKGFTK